MTPVVSVVIIFLNGETFLDEAIRSVIDQSITEWELILVDDGSSDGSATIARRWIASCPERVSLLQHEGGVNRGMSASRNLGWSVARGEFVAFLDADDCWEPHALALRVQEMRQHPTVDMVYGPARYWWSWSAATDQRDREQDLGDVSNRVHEPPALARQFLLDAEATPQLGTAMFRRRALERVGGSVVAFRGMYEDQVLAMKFALHGPVLVSALVICRYRQHAESTCAMSYADGTHVHERLRYLTWTEAHLQSSGVHDAEIERTLRQQKRRATASGSRLRSVRAVLARVLPQRVLEVTRRRLYGDQ